MALGAQGDEIVLGILAQPASPFDVMHLQSGHRAAGLASPAVPLEDFPVQGAVCLRVQANPSALGCELAHAASAARRRNSRLCS
ncbi:MAG TPA: hypothetical protein VE734_02225, partial [Terriglobales bacterium]|nr:hypothetical protein [Terriglobales bacterium]